jgi:dTDP-4-amino-4,6-dideoxygalactose transaminase
MITPFNKPFLTGKETHYIKEAVDSGKISGDGVFTKKCHQFLEQKYNFKKVLLTTSCTDALEMAAILLDIKEGDEIIAPSYTFVSTVNAFVLRGAKIVFVDSEINHPNMDVSKIEALITPKTKAIVPVHYAGNACDMDAIMQIATKHNLMVVEDAAQAIDSFYINNKGKKVALGSIGHMAAFSFHETKNIISGEGGMLAINDERFVERAEIIREKGTNRSKFFRGEVDKYGWVDIGSSFLPSDIIAAFLYAQLENIEQIQKKRIQIWDKYYAGLKNLESINKVKLPVLKQNTTNNAHMFYLVCKNIEERSELINHLKKSNIHAVFHYLSLHKSPFYTARWQSPLLPNSDMFTDCLLRLPFYYELTDEQQEKIIQSINTFYNL